MFEDIRGKVTEISQKFLKVNNPAKNSKNLRVNFKRNSFEAMRGVNVK